MTDEQILAIAAQLWQQNPGADFTMERLTDAIGISRATLYRRFGSREAILRRLVDEQSLDVQELSRPDIPTRVLQATRAILGRYGFVGVTVEQIAHEAGVGTATVYRHFGSREALLEAFVQTTSPRHLIRTFTASEQSDLKTDLAKLAKTLLEFIHDNHALARIMLFENQGGEAILEHVRTTQGRTVSSLANYLADHMAMGNLMPGDPFAMALSFIGMLLGLAFIGPHSYNRPITDFSATAEFVTSIFLQGVAQTDPQKLETHA